MCVISGIKGEFGWFLDSNLEVVMDKWLWNSNVGVRNVNLWTFS